MIDKNLGALERVVRLTVAAFLALWIISRPDIGMLECIAGIAALFLVLNAIFGRCYLWSWLGLSSCDCRRLENGQCESEGMS